jgi:hypothetical protein
MKISLTGDWNAGRGERLFFRTNLNPEVSGFASGFFESRKQLTPRANKDTTIRSVMLSVNEPAGKTFVALRDVWTRNNN